MVAMKIIIMKAIIAIGIVISQLLNPNLLTAEPFIHNLERYLICKNDK